jgi:DNA-binding transcriptional LysR family regulator
VPKPLIQRKALVYGHAFSILNYSSENMRCLITWPFRSITMAYQLDLRDLRYFETIAETGHLGRAAKLLSRTQPALTGCVRRLEAALGTSLFDHVGREIRLTAAGHALLARARHMRIAAEETGREIEEIALGLTGQIRLGVVPTVAHFLLPQVCSAFMAETKEVTLKTVLGQNDVLKGWLKSGEVDLVLGTDVQDDKDLISHPIFEDVCVVAASQGHEIFRRRATMQDLTKYRWVLAAPSVETRQWLDQAFDMRRLPRPRARIETNFVLLLPPLIQATGLLSFLSRRHLGQGRLGSRLKEVKLKETTMRRRFGVSYRRGGYLPPAARRLLTMLQSTGAALVDGN